MSQYAEYSGYGGGGSGGGGITSVNGATGPAITVAQGTGISVGTVGNTITISNTASSAFTPGNLTDVGTDGIVITGGTNAVNGSGTSIAQHVADSTHNGYLSSTDWSTFNNKQSTLTLGNLTDAGTDGITVTSGTGAVVGSGTSISQHVADSTHNGYLSSTDWSTFNTASGTAITALTGDVTATGPGSVAATIANNAVTNAKLAQMATLTIKGNNTGGASDPLDLTVAQINAILPIFTSSLNGLAPLSGGGTSNFLRADGTWAAPSGGFSNPMTTLGDIIYENASPAPARLAGNTTAVKNFLVQLGTGTVSAAPSWGLIQAGDVPTLNQNTTGTALNVSGTVLPANGGTGVNNNVNSTITISGNFGVTFTLTAGSSIILPTSGTVSTLAGTETFSNKTFSDAITDTQISTPSNPAAGKNKVYFKSDNLMYSLTSAGVETVFAALPSAVAATVYMTSTYSAGVDAPVIFDTVLFDTASAYSTGTGLYTVPTTGKYRVSFNGFVTAGASPGNMKVSINGNTGVGYLVTLQNNNVGSGSLTLSLTAADTIGIISDQSLSYLGQASPFLNSLSIEQIH